MRTLLLMAALAVAALAAPLAQGQSAATIALPEPGGIRQLYPGCNNIALTFLDGTASQTVMQAITPTGAVQTMWRHNATQNRFEGFSPAAPQASDLLTVNFLDAVWLCVVGAPAPPMPTPPPVAKMTPTPIPPPPSTAIGESRGSPVPRGQALVEPEGWEITVLAYVPNAWPSIQAENMFNEPPEPGYRMAMIRVRVRNVLADDPAHFWEGELKLVGSENIIRTTFERSCGVIPDDFTFMPTELFRGGMVEGNVCFQVPEQETSLVLITDFSWETKNRRYFAIE